jgi:probable rRNA maturation factor
MRKRVAGTSAAALGRFVEEAQRAAGLAGRLDVLIAGDGELRRLNRRFRGKDRATDVLSFPAEGTARPEVAGDIAISADQARRNAKRLGHSVSEELKVLLVHGVLHLAGYDHERDQGRMARKEERLRRAFGLPVSLTGRGTRAAPESAAQAASPERSSGTGRKRTR